MRACELCRVELEPSKGSQRFCTSACRKRAYRQRQREAVAMYTDNIDCAAAKRYWQRYMNNTLIPLLDKPENRDLKVALEHYDADYRKTVLSDAFAPAC